MNLRDVILFALEVGYEMDAQELHHAALLRDWPEHDPTVADVRDALDILFKEQWVYSPPRRPGWPPTYRRRTARQREELLAEQSGRQLSMFPVK